MLAAAEQDRNRAAGRRRDRVIVGGSVVLLGAAIIAAAISAHQSSRNHRQHVSLAVKFDKYGIPEDQSVQQSLAQKAKSQEQAQFLARRAVDVDAAVLQSVHELETTVGVLSAQLASLKMKPQAREHVQAAVDSAAAMGMTAQTTSTQQTAPISPVTGPRSESSPLAAEQPARQKSGVEHALNQLSHKLDTVIQYIVHGKTNGLGAASQAGTAAETHLHERASAKEQSSVPSGSSPQAAAAAGAAAAQKVAARNEEESRKPKHGTVDETEARRSSRGEGAAAEAARKHVEDDGRPQDGERTARESRGGAAERGRGERSAEGEGGAKSVRGAGSDRGGEGQGGAGSLRELGREVQRLEERERRALDRLPDVTEEKASAKAAVEDTEERLRIAKDHRVLALRALDEDRFSVTREGVAAEREDQQRLQSAEHEEELERARLRRELGRLAEARREAAEGPMLARELHTERREWKAEKAQVKMRTQLHLAQGLEEDKDFAAR